MNMVYGLMKSGSNYFKYFKFKLSTEPNWLLTISLKTLQLDVSFFKVASFASWKSACQKIIQSMNLHFYSTYILVTGLNKQQIRSQEIGRSYQRRVKFKRSLILMPPKYDKQTQQDSHRTWFWFYTCMSGEYFSPLFCFRTLCGSTRHFSEQFSHFLMTATLSVESLMWISMHFILIVTILTDYNRFRTKLVGVMKVMGFL